MAVPSTCAPGLNYWEDAAAGPGVDSDWTIETLGGNPTIEQDADSYRRTIDADSENLALQKYLSQTLGGLPEVLQMDLSAHIEYLTAGYSTTSAVPIAEIISCPAGISPAFLLRLKISGFPTAKNEVFLSVRDNVAGIEFDLLLFTVDFNISEFPISTDFSGTLRLVQAPGGNVEVYWDDDLKFTSASGLYPFDENVQIGLSRKTTAAQNHYATVKNISYVGTGALGTACPVPAGTLNKVLVDGATLFYFDGFTVVQLEAFLVEEYGSLPPYTSEMVDLETELGPYFDAVTAALLLRGIII